MQRIVLALMLLEAVARAQPGATEPLPYRYAPPPIVLTPEEQSTLQIGYVSDGQLIGGGLASVFLGLGIGQAIEGRWGDTGWIFTLGEPLAFGVMIAGAISGLTCDGASGCGNGGVAAVVVGAVGYAGLRIWEMVDGFTGPGRQNARLAAVQLKLGGQPTYARPFLVPANGGAMVGLMLRF